MAKEIKIEKKASEVIQPVTGRDAREAIRARQDLSGATLCGMELEGLRAAGSILRKTDLSAANLSHGLLVNPNLFRASLYGADVQQTVFLGGDLVRTSFKETNLNDTAFIGVNAKEASFKGANLHNAVFIQADLKEADFNSANLTDARLAGVNVTGADFTDASFSGARATNVDWSKAKVPPRDLPAPLFQIPLWAWTVFIGGMIGILGLIIYSRTRKKKTGA